MLASLKFVIYVLVILFITILFFVAIANLFDGNWVPAIVLAALGLFLTKQARHLLVKEKHAPRAVMEEEHAPQVILGEVQKHAPQVALERQVIMDEEEEEVGEIVVEQEVEVPRRRSRYISNKVRGEVWARDEGACVECGSNVDLHFDHIVPWSKGGGNHAENIQLLCQSCNLKKNNRIGE